MAAAGSLRTLNGITYRVLDSTFDPEVLFAFNKQHGSSPLNFIPDEPVKVMITRTHTNFTNTHTFILPPLREHTHTTITHPLT